jgi:hypothetical protein
VQIDAVDLTAFDHLLDDVTNLEVQPNDVTCSDADLDLDQKPKPKPKPNSKLHPPQDREVFDDYQELESCEPDYNRLDSNQLVIGCKRNLDDPLAGTSSSVVS